MPYLRCATCDERLEAGYEEALTIALATHIEESHGERVSLAELAPHVRGVMTGGGAGMSTQIAVARIASILVGIFFFLVALDLGPGWLAFSVLAGVIVVLLNVVEAGQR